MVTKNLESSIWGTFPTFGFKKIKPRAVDWSGWENWSFLGARLLSFLVIFGDQACASSFRPFLAHFSGHFWPFGQFGLSLATFAGSQ